MILTFLLLNINIRVAEILNFSDAVICSFPKADKDNKLSPGTGHKLLTVNHITIWIDQHTCH